MPEKTPPIKVSAIFNPFTPNYVKRGELPLSRALSEVFNELSANHTSQLGEVLSSLVELVVK